MHAPRVSLCALPPDVLEEIAFHVALSDVLGPPVHLIPLLCTCQHLNAVLCRRNNVYLYARIYAAKFDTRAAPRRMGPKAGLSSALAAQLPKYCTALRNIRRGDIDSPTLVTDFLRAFAMCLENDGKNAAQLEWAHLFEYAEQFILERLWEESESNSSSGWPVEDVTNSLVLWLYWYSSSQERFASKTAEERAQLMALVRPYALYGFRYPPFLAPDNHAHLPLPGSPEAYREHSTVTPHGYYPLYREPALCKHTFRHYGRALTLAEPPIGLIAKLLYIALQEHKPIDVDQPIPDDREEALLLGARGPTRADYIEFARTKAARYPVYGGSDLAMRHAGGSELHDNDWARWRGCFNPWGAPSRDRSAVYTFGSLTGNWAGRSLDPDGHEYTHATNAREFDAELAQPDRPDVTENPLFFTLREHCARARRGGRASALPHWDVQYRDPLDEGIMNAYFPRGWPEGYSAVEMGETLSIALRGRGRGWVYDTYVAGKEEAKSEARVGWSEDVEMVDGDGDGDGDEEEERVGRARREVQAVLGENMDVDELIDSMVSDSDDPSSRSSSSDSPTPDRDDHRDIIITGETQTHHALAWGNYCLYGRVRSWDGLVVLVRTPAPDPHHLSPFPERLEPYVFRGYLLGGVNLVGSWRHVTDSIHTIPVEGPFVVSRVVEQKAQAGA